MEHYDPQKAARVWQRVQAEQPAVTAVSELLEMIEDEWQDAATYLQLSRKFQGSIRDTLQKMFREEQNHAACLKGIYTLTTGGHCAVKSKPPLVEQAQTTLRRCYGREMRALARYESKSKDPQYGQVFSRLAAQEKEHCRLILELLGSIPTGKI